MRFRTAVMEVLCFIFLIGIAAYCQSTPSSDKRVATAYFVVQDRSGNPITDLKPEEITVQENGTAAQVVSIESAETIPVRLGILLLGGTPSFKAQREAALQLLSTLRPNIDQAFVLSQATSNKSRGWPGQEVNWDPDPKGLANFVRDLNPDSSLWGVTKIANKMLALNPERPYRRILVEFRDPSMEGMIDWGPLPFEQLERAQLNEIADYQRLNAMVYTFVVEDPFYGHGTGVPPAETMSRANASYLAYKDGQSKIERVADMTGGRFFVGPNGSFKRSVLEIEKDLKSQYLVRFTLLPESQDNAAHKLEVRVSRKDARVLNQKQFYAPRP